MVVRGILDYCNRFSDGGSESSRAVWRILLPILAGPVLDVLGSPVPTVGVPFIDGLPSTFRPSHECKGGCHRRNLRRVCRPSLARFSRFCRISPSLPGPGRW